MHCFLVNITRKMCLMCVRCNYWGRMRCNVNKPMMMISLCLNGLYDKLYVRVCVHSHGVRNTHDIFDWRWYRMAYTTHHWHPLSIPPVWISACGDWWSTGMHICNFYDIIPFPYRKIVLKCSSKKMDRSTHKIFIDGKINWMSLLQFIKSDYLIYKFVVLVLYVWFCMFWKCHDAI